MLQQGLKFTLLPEVVPEPHSELGALSESEGVTGCVRFIRSFSDHDKELLLHRCHSVIYTPSNEHFGIVPIEAMSCGRPVIAAASGGPLETIEHEVTGLLGQPTAQVSAPLAGGRHHT